MRGRARVDVGNYVLIHFPSSKLPDQTPKCHAASRTCDFIPGRRGYDTKQCGE
jgi:hypothetical protein